MRTLLLLVVCAALVFAGALGPVFAQNIDRVDIGHKYYLYRFSEPNELVEVVKVDRHRKRVQVKNAQEALDWVRPAELLTSAESVAPGSATYLGAAGVVLCMLDPTTCSQALRHSTTRAPSVDDRTSLALTPDGTPAPVAAPRPGYRGLVADVPAQPTRAANAGVK